MFRFTIRDALWLAVVVAMAAAVFFTRSARESDLRQATRRASDQEMEAANARYEAAKGEFDWERSLTHGTYAPRPITFVCEVIERFAHASELKDDPALRVNSLASALDFAQELALSTQEKHEQGVEPISEVYRTQYTRADMEARLRRAEQELAAARENK
jgi:hypothetical protein